MFATTINCNAQTKLFLRNGVLVDIESSKFDSIYLVYQRDGKTTTIKNSKIFALSSSDGTQYLIGRKARRQRDIAPIFYPSNKRFSFTSVIVLAFRLNGFNIGLDYTFGKNYGTAFGFSVITASHHQNDEPMYYRADFKRYISLIRRTRAYYGVTAIIPEGGLFINLGHKSFLLSNLSIRNGVGFGANPYEFSFILETGLEYNFNVNRSKSTHRIG
jgi:hypothetical protein